MNEGKSDVLSKLAKLSSSLSIILLPLIILLIILLLVWMSVGRTQLGGESVTPPSDMPPIAMSENVKLERGVIYIPRLQLRESTLRVDPMMDFNLLQALRERTNWRLTRQRVVVRLDNEEIFKYPFIVFGSEHQPMNLNEREREKLRRYLVGGGFLYIDDCSAKLRLRSDLRAEINRLIPGVKLAPLPLSHSLYHCFYDIKQIKPSRRGGMRYHEGLTVNGRLVLLYTLNAEGCSWQSWKWMGPLCACLPPDFDYAFEFAVNMIFYALTH